MSKVAPSRSKVTLATLCIPSTSSARTPVGRAFVMRWMRGSLSTRFAKTAAAWAGVNASPRSAWISLNNPPWIAPPPGARLRSHWSIIPSVRMPPSCGRAETSVTSAPCRAAATAAATPAGVPPTTSTDGAGAWADAGRTIAEKSRAAMTAAPAIRRNMGCIQ